LIERQITPLVAGIFLASASCSLGTSPATGLPSPPAAELKAPTSVGQGEGVLNVVTWDGYADDSWVKAFTAQTGCKINPRYAGSSAEIASLMSGGGGGRWDLVSAPGDISLQLIYNGDVRPMNVKLIPSWADFAEQFQSPPFNTVAGVHYGVSLQWSPNVLLYNTTKLTLAPNSWAATYDPTFGGKVTVPDNPMQIADAALYLEAVQPGLAIKDPFELNRTQFNAAASLLGQQHALIKRYWAIASDEIAMFQDGEVVVGGGNPYQANELQSVGVPVAEVSPAEGTTGWVDSWMLATKVRHPNCAYLWMAYTATPQVQASQALLFGETPVNSQACAAMNIAVSGSCAKYHADATASDLKAMRFWKTPLAQCGASDPCVAYDEWISAWNAIRG
jgi:putative spermidine/putrescine transport system substrate-binding protein